jgi:hypothetical protein
MAEELKPAMTAGEWKHRSVDVALGVVYASLGSDPVLQTGDLEAIGEPAPWLTIDWNLAGDRVSVSRRHALAALALHEQPFGFTHDDVTVALDGAALCKVSGNAYGETKFRDLAARIAAFLPPENPNG